ncbi:nitric oxide reductase subunit B [Symbiobacterium terraclitae]|uniref:Nitric oxide reductase subunit B n=1 Tax=Symbiobacterium terraclitae TaxID=557451 RepID=A0ABS4JPG8_9FIRM|nr:nitric oxide reductase subunit B [Symbiobacterium terraclitae]
MRYTRLWLALALVIAASFAVLGYYGWDTYWKAPPIPERVVTTDGAVLFTGDDIRDGQNVWQSMGGQEVGSVWGHGAYVAPDWTADWLHREAVWILDAWADEAYGTAYEDLDPEAQAALRARLMQELRTNSYDPATGDLVVSPLRAEAIRAVAAHYDSLFGADPSLADLREAYAIRANTVPDPARRAQMSAFFFWSSWAASTNRPGSDVTYTNNWPPEQLVGNRPTGEAVVWSVVSFVLLLAGVGALVWYYAAERHRSEGELYEPPASDPLLSGLKVTPSMKVTLPYFWIVAALVMVQILMGVITAHYGVEGSGFYGIPLDRWIPYSLARTWHTQLGIFWIATSWLATGLFIAPAVSGYEPPLQRAGVLFLLVCLVIIVGGSLAGQAVAVQQGLSLEANFWFGHQGLEYVDLGRFWQWFLFVGLFLWLALMLRALLPALRKPGEQRNLLFLFVLSSFAIALFYGAGLMYGRQTNYAMIEYWRWWVVHLWVEGFFEVFATVVIAFLFTRLGLLRTTTATATVLFSTIIFLSGGIIGTFHHLYFTGTSMAVMALGAVFSALEVVPLVLIGFEGYENLTLSRSKPWVREYRWPIYFFVAVAFWNLVGAGLFGFFINPPIALYYMQGLNTTPVHGHTALFGVYGLLGMALTLFCLRGMTLGQRWNDRLLSFAFWWINVGLALMVLLSLLPLGLLQTWASVEHGMWYARSAEFMQSDLMNRLRWLRVVGDTIFAVGCLAFGWFVVTRRPNLPQQAGLSGD